VFGRAAFAFAAILASSCTPSFERPECYSAYECPPDTGEIEEGSDAGPDAGDAQLDGGGEADARDSFDAGVLSGTWTEQPGPNPPAREGAAISYSPVDRALVLAGGCGRTELAPCSQSWAFRGESWSQLSFTAEFTPGRRGAVLADIENGGLLIFGGESSASNAALDDSWTYDGFAWSSVQSPVIPSARMYAAAAYDPVHRAVVLFGGASCEAQSGCEIFGDTCIYEDRRWSCMTLPGPAARSGHAMVYDSASGRMILFGGRGARGLLADIWFFDGAAWREGPSPGATFGAPSARAGHALAFDAIRGIAVLFGGELDTSAPPVLDDRTWELHDDYWVPVDTASTPPARSRAAMGYDSGGSSIILFGGRSESDVLGDSWGYGAR
jgi:hypothetical protein